MSITRMYFRSELVQLLGYACQDMCCLADFESLMLDQNACRFHGRIAYDRHYSGMALKAAEGARVAQLMGSGKSALFMGNRGVIVVAPSVAQAFDELYYFEKAAAVQVLVLSTGWPLAPIPESAAAQVGAQSLAATPARRLSGERDPVGVRRRNQVGSVL